MLLIAAVLVFVRELYLVVVTQRSFIKAVKVAFFPIFFAGLLFVYQNVFLPWTIKQNKTLYLDVRLFGEKHLAVVRRSIKSPLNLRDAPGGRVIASLPPGTQVALLSREVRLMFGVPWIKVRVIDGPSGWVSLCYLDLK